jgi:hypothetical protein
MDYKKISPNRTSRCMVSTSKPFMIIYEILYIIGLTLVVIGGIMEFYFSYDRYLMGSIVIASIFFVMATILWAIDRKCEPVK